MEDIKEFDLCDVISAGTGRLVSKNGIGGVYEVLNYMTGESLFTHQLPRVSREAAPVLRNHHAWFAAVEAEAKNITPENWKQWLEKWENAYGSRVTAPKMTITEHERIDPISELAERVHPDKIVVFSPDGAPQ